MQQIRDLGVETVVVKSEEDILSAIGDADAYFGGMTPADFESGEKNCGGYKRRVPDWMDITFQHCGKAI